MGAIAIDTSLSRPVGFYEAYVGKKFVMAVTGVMLVGYIFGHLAGNLQIFIPPKIVGGQAVYQINTYARLLHSSEALLWAVRTVLIAVVALHVWSAFLLWLMKRRARPQDYIKKDDVGVTYASRTMLWSGPIIAAFVVFHILHLTTGNAGLGYQGPVTGAGGSEQFFAYQNLVRGFRHVPVAIGYMVAVGLLSLHLYHGIWSMFQSIGVSHPQWMSRLKLASRVIAWLIAAGYISIPVAVLARVVGSEVP